MAHGERIELSQSVLETNSPALEHCRIKIVPAAPSSAILAKGFGVAIAQGFAFLFFISLHSHRLRNPTSHDLRRAFGSITKEILAEVGIEPTTFTL